MILVKSITGPTIYYDGSACIVIRLIDKREFATETHGLFEAAEYQDGEAMDPRAVANEALRLAEGRIQLVVITGGEPVLQDGEAMATLVDLLQVNGMLVQVETNGTLDARWLAECAAVTVSPKRPLSKCKINWKHVTSIKLLYPHPDKEITPESFLPLCIPLYLQPVWGDSCAEAIAKVISLAPNAKLSLQTHKMTGVR